MPDSFKGSESITLQPGDVFVPILMKFPPASATTSNDGAIPYGSTVASATVSLHHSISGTRTTAPVKVITATSNRIVAYCSYASTLESGLYHLKALVNVVLAGRSTAMVREFDLRRVYVVDR